MFRPRETEWLLILGPSSCLGDKPRAVKTVRLIVDRMGSGDLKGEQTISVVNMQGALLYILIC